MAMRPYEVGGMTGVDAGNSLNSEQLPIAEPSCAVSCAKCYNPTSGAHAGELLAV